jgi:iron complex transport system substrate-binding protein
MKLKYAILTLLCVLLALGMAGCLPGSDKDKPSSSSEPVSQEEQLPELPAEFPVEVGGTVVASRPGKVVSLSPAITEKIFDLGLTDRLAGVSDFCADFIPDAAGSEKCGTAQQPELEVILGLGAHLVVSEIPLPEEDQAALRD